ncbi:hypothetical protein JCM3775_006122 [Rhodotorula graminis]|uniref:Chromo domain-containing protein n=1 Tax=Rhodotorula graminis (strain WP1) TaxID=578459 RepID=A0A194S4Z4_RHOGW|nr:uncharacterized protein RHOBADRAFT_54299 [Rhodotorula graminis WP1]KPV74486.1 hypothetical protein RHOBADRAFT_54299 [Rhodotorula graminis WP1]
MPRTAGTAATKKKVAKKEPTPEPEEYVMSKILAHKRKGANLKYQVEWLGYEDDEPTWEPEHNVGEGPVVEKYWKTCKTPLDRYAPGSKAYRAAKAAQASASPPKPKTKKRASAGSDDDDVAAADEAEKPKKRGRRSTDGGAAADAAGKKKKVVDESPVVEDEEEEQDGLLSDGEVDLPEDERLVCFDWEEKYGALDSWETEVKEIETMEQDERDHSLRVCVVWQADDSVSWLDSAVVRQKAPQKLLDFFVGHLKWKKPAGDDDDASVEGDDE